MKKDKEQTEELEVSPEIEERIKLENDLDDEGEVKGEKIGTVVTIKDEDGEWINFHEGGRLAKDLKEEFIKPLEDDLAQEFIKTQPQTINPLDVPPPKNNTTLIPLKETSPIRVLFNKQKNNSKVKLLLEFPINIPSKGIYELMSTSFDREEVNEELHDFIADQLSQDEITDCLFDSIKSLIKSKYK